MQNNRMKNLTLSFSQSVAYEGRFDQDYSYLPACHPLHILCLNPLPTYEEKEKGVEYRRCSKTNIQRSVPLEVLPTTVGSSSNRSPST